MIADNPSQPPVSRPRQAVELTESECWDLLSSTSLGRIVFTQRAMPAIRPVNHLVDNRLIVIRTHLGAAIAARTAGDDSGTVVCYEADDLDPVRHTGWSVIVTGIARLVRNLDTIDRYAAQLEPWIAGDMDQLVTITPHFTTGLRLVGWCA